MLRGEVAGLRAREDRDVPILHAELYEDVTTRVRADSRPWRPIPADAAGSPYRVEGRDQDSAAFSVVHLASGELAGEALVWGIDRHNRSAHLGISLRPGFRRRGLGTDTVRLLCGYGFAILGLQRLQAETLADNAAMIAAATRAGFVPEGTLRRAAWVNGRFADEVILGMLAGDWHPAPSSQPGS
jgi:RimJ/RimL family protein N-acetyltransferase